MFSHFNPTDYFFIINFRNILKNHYMIDLNVDNCSMGKKNFPLLLTFGKNFLHFSVKCDQAGCLSELTIQLGS